MSTEGTTPKSWWLEELTYAGQEHLDATYISGYDRKSGFDPIDDVAVLRAYGLDANSTVVDLGAGTGRFLLAAAPVCRRLTAVDVSPAMTTWLSTLVEREGFANVNVVRAGFLSYEHQGPPADFVYSRHALHQLPDFWKVIALQRIAAFMRPGGILRLRDLVWDFGPAETDDRMEDWLAGAVDDSAVGWTAAELAEHARIEFSTFSWLLELMLERTGFELLNREFRRSVYGSYTCRRT